ncbi:MAG: hypothetical protein FWE19_06005 [Oscillospiraceae bacterium]|nr:hypothetical protein [Oscillospiraceae bacterium]
MVVFWGYFLEALSTQWIVVVLGVATALIMIVLSKADRKAKIRALLIISVIILILIITAAINTRNHTAASTYDNSNALVTEEAASNVIIHSSWDFETLIPVGSIGGFFIFLIHLIHSFLVVISVYVGLRAGSARVTLILLFTWLVLLIPIALLLNFGMGIHSFWFWVLLIAIPSLLVYNHILELEVPEEVVVPDIISGFIYTLTFTTVVTAIVYTIRYWSMFRR